MHPLAMALACVCVCVRGRIEVIYFYTYYNLVILWTMLVYYTDLYGHLQSCPGLKRKITQAQIFQLTMNSIVR